MFIFIIKIISLIIVQMIIFVSKLYIKFIKDKKQFSESNIQLALKMIKENSKIKKEINQSFYLLSVENFPKTTEHFDDKLVAVLHFLIKNKQGGELISFAAKYENDKWIINEKIDVRKVSEFYSKITLFYSKNFKHNFFSFKTPINQVKFISYMFISSFYILLGYYIFFI